MGKLKELRSEGVKTYVLQLKNYAKKAVVLTPQRPKGVITSLTSITSELAKVQYYINILVKPIKVPFKGFECPFKGFECAFRGFERTFRGFEQTFQST